MAIKNAIYQVDNGNGFDEIHFKTKAEQVYCKDGKTVEVSLGEKAGKEALENGSILVGESRVAFSLREVLTVLPATSEINSFKLWLPDKEEVNLCIFGYLNEDTTLAIREGFMVNNYSDYARFSNGVSLGGKFENHWGMILGILYAGSNTINIKIRRNDQRIYITGHMGDGVSNTIFNGYGGIEVGKQSEIDIRLFIKHATEIYAKISYSSEKGV